MDLLILGLELDFCTSSGAILSKTLNPKANVHIFDRLELLIIPLDCFVDCLLELDSLNLKVCLEFCMSEHIFNCIFV